jgi:ABC-2 type transport system ATP-binding protein
MLEGGEGRIVARGVTRRFGDKLALAPLDLEVGPGGVTGLLGPNGSGKTTLLRVLIGLTPPDAGEVSVDGAALRGDGLEIRKRCCYSPGEIAMYGELKGSEHLDWLLRGRDAQARATARAYAERFELPLQRRVHAYSHGMKRQLLFAAAMAPRVRVRILDEPSEGLDPTKRGVLIELLREDAARGTTILLSSHHLGEVDRACQRFVFIHAGKLIASESAESVAARARRLLRVSFAPRAGLDDALRRGSERLALHARSVSTRDSQLLVELSGDDPRPALAELAKLAELGAPTGLEFGRASLQELYRDLYGVEAC